MARSTQNNSHMCPVCGYLGLEEPPEDYTICPCCGCEFGYTDSGSSSDTLRAEWIDRGSPWWSRYTEPPEGWDPEDQLRVFENVRSGKVKIEPIKKKRRK